MNSLNKIPLPEAERNRIDTIFKIILCRNGNPVTAAPVESIDVFNHYHIKFFKEVKEDLLPDFEVFVSSIFDTLFTMRVIHTKESGLGTHVYKFCKGGPWFKVYGTAKVRHWNDKWDEARLMDQQFAMKYGIVDKDPSIDWNGYRFESDPIVVTDIGWNGFPFRGLIPTVFGLPSVAPDYL